MCSHPTDDDISTSWMSTRPRAERMQAWADYVEHSDQVSEENRAKMKTRMAKESLYHPSDCRAAPTSPETATVPLVEILDGPYHFEGWGLDVKFNGKGRRLQVDTGAGGITISRAAALFLGIKREDETEVGGIGDQGKVRTSIAHVASVKIGGIEFTNCAVEILEKWSVLDSDGLIGGDVFSASQLTLDFPKRQLRISPLPARPGEAKPGTTLDAAGNDEAETWHDPYVAPEMAKWVRVYRSGHDLLMPTGVVDTKRIKDESAWKDKLFVLDSGSEINLISPAAAREVTKVGRDETVEFRGISGAVDKVYEAGKFTLAFARAAAGLAEHVVDRHDEDLARRRGGGVGADRRAGAVPGGAAHRLPGQPGVVRVHAAEVSVWGPRVVWLLHGSPAQEALQWSAWCERARRSRAMMAAAREFEQS